MVNPLITEANNFLKNSGSAYAFCGGNALELFLDKKLRTHSDIDITVFPEEKETIVEYMIANGWDVFSHHHDWVNHTKTNAYLRKITTVTDEPNVWAVKPGCSLISVKQNNDDNIYDYEIISNEQLQFDFLEIIFNEQVDGCFICDKGKQIGRQIGKAIKSRDGIPYLAPEIILFIISNPEYLLSSYHKEKNQIDYSSVAPFLNNESKEWLIASLERAYPEGTLRLDQLRNNDYSLLS